LYNWINSLPQAMYIPNGESSMIRTHVLSGDGQSEGAPNGELGQSKERISLPISPPPDKKAGNTNSRLEPACECISLKEFAIKLVNFTVIPQIANFASQHLAFHGHNFQDYFTGR
jgi:hypothetical protein